ncbi:MAG: nodulation protein NfeD, partial [Gammaproteobacteria bacterium]|nr:nodulation protein NfeD [Gammaproteobacteria bacterium]
GLGGIAAFVFGSIILLDSDIPGLAIARALIGGVALTASTVLLAMVYLLMRIRRKPAVSGVESMLSDIAEALEDFDKSGTVFVNGERWNARSTVAIKKGDQLRITAVDHLVLEVEPLKH